MEKKNNVVVMNINNVQKDYSNSLELIEYLERIKNWDDLRRYKSRISDLLPQLKVSCGVIGRGVSVKYFEMPLVTSEPQIGRGWEKNAIENVIALAEGNFQAGRWKSLIEDKKKRYHIRIHVTEMNWEYSVINFQYLVLLLQRLNGLIRASSATKQRLSVFIVPLSGEKYPFCIDESSFDNSLYENISHYLRLISNDYKGVIFSAVRKGTKIDVTSIDFKITAQPREYFPVIPMEISNYHILFEEKLCKEQLERLFNLGKGRRFGDAATVNEEQSLRDYVAEAAFRRLEKVANGQRIFLNTVYNEIITENTRMSWIAFALFCYTIQSVDSDIAYALEIAQDLCDGIRQIVQNAIQHSQTHTGVFTFYLYTHESGQFPETLEIFVSDLNYEYSILEKFAENLEREKNTFANLELREVYECLIKKKESYSLCNFFAEFRKEDAQKEWMTFRKQNSSAHVGLLLFAIIAQRCGATIQAGSSKTYIRNGMSHYYFKSYEEEENIDSQMYEYEGFDEEVIPGAQFSVRIPLGKTRKTLLDGLGQLYKANNIQEDYDSFAQYIGYQGSPVSITDAFNSVKGIMGEDYVCDSQHKLQVIQLWSVGWRNLFESCVQSLKSKKVLHYVDVEELNSQLILKNVDDIEVLIKGFFDAAEEIGRFNLHEWSFINANEDFMSVFRDVCIAFSARRFPENLQLFVCEKKCTDSMILFGDTYYEAIHNGYLLAIEHGTRKLSSVEYSASRKLFQKINGSIEESRISGRDVKVIPFDVILKCDKPQEITIFEKRIVTLANEDIDGEKAGYKITHTHMRLGSKVHIQSFYEMTFLFYRTSIANRIAFEILQDMYEKKSFSKIDIEKDVIVFLGYASYSKAILTSLVEILKIYRGGRSENVALASYQHNLQSESEEIQMYYEFRQDFPASYENGKVFTKQSLRIIQVVPISSTLTTFEKMWMRFRRDISEDSVNRVELYGNYSVFWVMNSEKNEIIGQPSKLEQSYWKYYSPKQHIIETLFQHMGQESNIRFFIRQPVAWSNPLKCEMCYPDNVIDEIPLVETDQTSTVPTQQIRKRKEIKTVIEDELYNERLIKLNGCVSYGHIKRDRNHFQMYIDTQAYFSKVQKEVEVWLEKCRDKNDEKLDFPVLHILFSPEHNTNVGFAQYVNTYYFGGSAEIVSINEDKEFRSNFECEHTALMKTIEVLFHNIEWSASKILPVKFYYVDDTIVSGGTFQKANSFLRTLIPDRYKHLYGSNVISKCFLLVDRMSHASKQCYVQDVCRDFLSFVHIDVSNVRNQGDSCIGCKLEREAIRLFKRSSTNNAAIYWINKIKDYCLVAYDNREEINNIQTKQAFQRLMISHITQNVIFNENDFFEYGNAYDAMLMIAYKLVGLDVKEFDAIHFRFDKLLVNLQYHNGINDFLKIISRPFFSYDFKIKLQTLTLLIILMEVFLGKESEVRQYLCDNKSSKVFKNFLLENGKRRLSRTIKLGKTIRSSLDNRGKILFLQNCLMKSLTDMRSTYLLRKSTIKNILNYIHEMEKKQGVDYSLIDSFWKTYASSIQYIVDCSSDEMRSMGMECLLITGMEYRDFSSGSEEKFSPEFLYKSITGQKCPNSRDLFYIFCHELLFQNTMIHFGGLEKAIERGNAADVYFMEQWRQAQYLEKFERYDMPFKDNEKKKLEPTEAEKALFLYLQDNQRENTRLFVEVKKRYDELLSYIVSMINEKYKISFSEICISLLTQTTEGEIIAKIDDFDILANVNAENADCRYEIKEMVVEALNARPDSIFKLEEEGYFIAEDQNTSYCILFFKNENSVVNSFTGRSLKPIARVFLFFSMQISDETKRFFYPRFVVRDLLAYKNRIMRMLENDFAGDMFTKYSHTMGEKNIFAHEKAINHNTIMDNDELLDFLKTHTESGKYEMLDSNQAIKWLALRNYVNEQIARIFNRCFLRYNRSSETVLRKSLEAPQLYLDENVNEYLNDNDFCQKFIEFGDLQLFSDDRFVLLASVISIEVKKLRAACIIQNKKADNVAEYYNLEYVKCLIFDIFFSAMKYQSCLSGFLARIDEYLKDKKTFAISGWMDVLEIEGLEKCEIKVFREDQANEKFDYLVFENPVHRIIRSVENENLKIERRLADPLDYQDGHMSLLTIKQYVEGLREDLKGKAIFQYIKKGNEITFQTKLPILSKEVLKNEKNILD